MYTRDIVGPSIPDNDGADWHHIVAQADPRAKPARDVFDDFGISCHDNDNLVLLRRSFHQHLNTNSYHTHVNAVVTTAYSERSVRDRLDQLRLEITSYSYTGICPW